MRIVSLTPSATEVVCALGLRDQLVGVTHECDYPESVDALARVTRSRIPEGTSSGEIDQWVRESTENAKSLYRLDMETLESLEPELIVTQALCDVCAVAETEVRVLVGKLPGATRVINLQPACLQDVLDDIARVGSAVSIEHRAAEVIAGLEYRVEAVAERARRHHHRPRMMLLEWVDPPFSAGHWSPELVEIAGGREVIGIAGERSAVVDWERVVAADPEILVVACCGFTPDRAREDLPILESYPGWSSLSCVRQDQIHVVDGSAYFSRPGPRLVDSLELLADLVDKFEARAAELRM